jgi:spermidine synthase
LLSTHTRPTHPTHATQPQEIHIAEIDGAVPEVSKRYFPAMAVGFSDPRVKVHICDGIK